MIIAADQARVADSDLGSGIGMSATENEANAALIVTAVNSFADSQRKIEVLEAALKLAAGEVMVCPNCNNVGYYAAGPTDDPEQVQCEFCYAVPNSLFNVKEKARAALTETER